MNKVCIVFLVMLALSSYSCLVAVYDSPGSPGLFPVDTFHREIPLERGGTLSLENGSGDIRIQGWDREEVDVRGKQWTSLPRGTRMYPFPWRFSPPDVDIDRFENFVRIRASGVEGERGSGAVDFDIRVPRLINLKDILAGRSDIRILDLCGEAYVQVDRGEVEVENFSGSLTAWIGEGFLRAALVDLREEDDISLSVEDGDIALYLAEDIRATVRVSVPNGKVLNEFRTVELDKEEEGAFQLGGEGGVSVYLTALNGDVEIHPMRMEEMRSGGRNADGRT